VASVLEVPNWLHVRAKPELSCGIDHCSVHYHFVQSLVDLGKVIVVSTGYCEGGDLRDAAESKEVGEVGKTKGVQDSGGCDVLGVCD